MEQMAIAQTVVRLGECMEKGGYAKSRILQFNSTTNQLLRYMDSNGIDDFDTGVGISFLESRYGFKRDSLPSQVNRARLVDLCRLSEFQLHRTYMLKRRNRKYDIPENFRVAADVFLAYRRFEGIIERNMSTISLYLERFFHYLTAQSVTRLPQVETRHIHGYLRYIMGFTAQSRDHMMRTVRQFLGFCYKNDYLPEDLSPFVPFVHYEKRARIQIKFRVSARERELIEQKMTLIGTRNMAAYLRKMAMDGKIIRLEVSELKEIVRLLRYSSNNLNQLTKQAHETGAVYGVDVAELRDRFDSLWEMMNQILIGLAKL